ncbi:hypothetical protein B0T16DRAFT_417396 [Cercophora newfieldiana]|uniref:Protein kinase domain-containing protein n=1 Tax=Cercophora newfieldiana TaxID=92897 RepID=A0AA40CMR2_9PEZI|nr:hypothetical protein B0T16DRAFT_417396 [Cercophora newfieldiana]
MWSSPRPFLLISLLAMATGLEVLGAVAASLELVKVASVCLSICKDFQATGVHTDQQDARFNLLTQAWRFEKWCSALGILEVIMGPQQRPGEWNATPEFERFKASLVTQLRLEDELVASIILATLANMQEKLQEATNILGRYSPVASRQPSPAPMKEKNSRWTRLVKTQRVIGNNGAAPQGKNGPSLATKGAPQSSTFRWFAVDKSKLDSTLESVEKNNNRLLQLMEPVLRTQIERRADMVILDNIDQSTASALPEDSDLHVLAKIKQWHVVDEKIASRGTLTPDNSSAPSLISPAPSEEAAYQAIQTYQPETFARGTLPLGAARSMSMLNGQKVMVEWRYCSSETTTRRDPTRRLGGLVSLLNRNKLYERFLTLPCLRGLAVDSPNSRIGIVFSLDGVAGVQSIESLQDVIQRVALPVSVGQRFKLARDIATGLHHLHSVRWLHKSIRSDNILCFSPVIKNLLDAEAASTAAWSKAKLAALKQPGMPTTASSGAATDYIPALPPLTNRPDPLPQFYLVGWDLSRPEHASELSETLSVSTAGYRSRRDAIRMYSHPDAHAESASKQQYRPEFDIYSLGLVLLEIGLWRTIDTIWKQCQGDAGFRLMVRTEYCDRLLGKMGEVYWRVVQRCLNDDFGVGKESTDGDLSLRESFEKNVVCELERCYA